MFQICKQNRDARGGFTLTELLVSLTISVIVLGAVFVAFNASNRAVRQGYQQMRGYELARGTFDILTSDVETAFTQREYADNHKFFGTPIGFTYIGTANPGTGAGAANVPQLARVTYVVYFGDPLNPGSGQQGSGRVTIQEAYDGFAPDEVTGTQFYLDQQVITYSLLRFVEPGVGDLDSWPAIEAGNLERNMWDVLATGESPQSQLIAEYLAEPIEGLPELDYNYGQRDGFDRRLPAPTPEQQLLQEARKRELWIRMLAGDPFLPDLWNLLDRDPRDFVVAENIFLPANISPILPEFTNPNFVFFQYGVSQRQPMRVDAAGNINPNGQVVLDGERLATTGELRLREGQANERWHLYWSSAYNLLYDETTGQDSRNLNLIQASFPGSLRPINVFGAVGDADFQGVNLDELARNSNIVNPYNANSVPGTPYDSQLPEQIHVRFEYLLESPWAGVSEFKRQFDKIMDVPSGYTRKPPPTVAGL